MKAFIPSSLSEQDYRNNPEAAAQNWQDAAGYEKNRQVIQGLTVKSRYGAVFSQETTLYGVSRKGDERRPFNILGDKHTAGGMRTILTAEDVLNGKSDLSLQAGGSYRYGRYFWNTSETLPEGESGALLTDQKQNRHQGALFLFAAYRIGDITAEAGLNVSAIGYTTSSNMDSNNEDYERYNPGAVALPYFFARYQLTPHTDLYATTGRGHASPVYEEAIDSEGNIDTGLLPEYSWKREAGMKTETAHFTFQGALYHNSVSNQLITKRLAEDRYIKENAGETDFSGVEAVMGVRLFSNKVLSINADINYSYSQYKFKEFVDENNDYSGNKVPGIPAHQGGVVLSIHMWNKLQLHYRWSGMSKMPMNDANNKYYGGHQLMNLHLTYREQILKKLHLTTFARAGNIGGVHYASMILVNARGFGGAEPRYYYPGAPTNFQAGVRLNYNF
jgi:iron complex outermembrane receptor protein